MDIYEQLVRAFGPLERPSRQELNAALRACHILTADLEPVISPPIDFPYSRTLLYKSEHIEVLGMSWAHDRQCAPHDHGQSWGLVKILEGRATHAIYSLKGGIPVLRIRSLKEAGTTLFAPKGMIHSMGNPSSNRLITLHVYTPEITNMMVYDIPRCAACIVADDCGAWWPATQRQIVREIRLKDHATNIGE